MIKVTIVTNAGRNEVMVSEDTTIREILDDNNVNYAVGTTSIDGCPLKAGDMDCTLDEMGIETKCFLSVVVKADSAAKGVIAGNAFIVTSSAKLEDLRTIKKLRPKALELYEGTGSEKKIVFAIGLTEKSAGHLNENGATFSPCASKDGNATITYNFTGETTDIAAEVHDKFGLALLRLNTLEATFESVLEEIKADAEKIKGMITSM